MRYLHSIIIHIRYRTLPWIPYSPLDTVPSPAYCTLPWIPYLIRHGSWFQPHLLYDDDVYILGWTSLRMDVIDGDGTVMGKESVSPSRGLHLSSASLKSSLTTSLGCLLFRTTIIAIAHSHDPIDIRHTLIYTNSVMPPCGIHLSSFPSKPVSEQVCLLFHVTFISRTHWHETVSSLLLLKQKR